MCGIAGIWGRLDEDLVRKMMKRLVHRGPDAEGLFADTAGTLGHQRLSIMDPAGGDQPIYSADGRRAIIANGEVYNFPRLREEQIRGGHNFRTRNDSESALHAYEDVGTGSAEKLDGMFSFAIADGEDVFLVRDPIGIKPLYVGSNDGKLVFSSELKSIAGCAEDVHEFPPGTWYHSRHGFHRYYEVPDHAPVERSVEEHCKLVRDTLERAVVKRLMSDVPLGSFLSGGLDSSLIAAIARQHVDELHTFSVGIEGSRDLEAARLVSKHIDSVHHEYLITMDEVIEELPKIVHSLESYDQDLVRSAIPCHFTSRLAAEHVKVILTGEGADELFAGYTYYKGMPVGPELHEELRRSVCTLHNINLQRVDRLTMAHSLEGRVPFLDVEMIEMAQTIPPELKLLTDPDTGQQVEKWILRKACEDLLPREIVWRDKEQFDEGSGTVDLMAEHLPRLMEKIGPLAEGEGADADLRSDEERTYYKILQQSYEAPQVVLDNVARWSHRPDILDLPDDEQMLCS
jgi:asparagine synthase (glutamine-hydrolysing)